MGKLLQNIGETIAIIVLGGVSLLGAGTVDPTLMPTLLGYVPTWLFTGDWAGWSIEFTWWWIPLVIVPLVVVLGAKGQLAKQPLTFTLIRSETPSRRSS